MRTRAMLATETEGSLAAQILGRAFAGDPVLTAFVGTDQTPRMTRYFELECRVALAGYGEVWLDEDGLGAALWSRPRARTMRACARLGFQRRDDVEVLDGVLGAADVARAAPAGARAPSGPCRP
jgi:hypothetical protein